MGINRTMLTNTNTFIALTVLAFAAAADVEFKNEAEHKIEKGKLLETLEYLGKTFSISFDLLIEKLPDAGYASILHGTIGQDCSKRGDRLPMVKITNTSFIVVSDLDKDHPCGMGWNKWDFGELKAFGLKVGEWAKVELTQQKFLSTEVYVFEIKVAGKRIQSLMVNEDPKKYEKVALYAGSPWYNAADAKIKNLIITSKEE